MKTFSLQYKVILWLTLVLAASCTPKADPEYIYLRGEAQGSTFSITYLHPEDKDFSQQVDSMFRALNHSLSIYEEGSLINDVNENKTNQLDEHLSRVVSRGQEISAQTNGQFDMTVGPVVRVWGFGKDRKQKVDQHILDSLLQFVGYNRIKLNDALLIKSDPRIQIDVNAIAQGYSVDVIALFLENNGVSNYMVEIGGEVRTKGINSRGTAWQIGVDKPVEDSLAENRELQVVLAISGVSVATSGNYRKFYQEGDKKISHTINPVTGYPVGGSLLSTSIVATDCMSADAYATACMVMQLDSAMQFVNAHPELAAYFIYADEKGDFKTVYTSNFEKYIAK